MATFRSFSDLEQQLIKDVRLAAESARNEIDKELQDNVMDYYGFGNPVKYERTGTLLESPNTTPVSGVEIILHLSLIWMKIFHIIQEHFLERK